MSSKIFKPFNKVMGAIGLVDTEDEVDVDNEYNEYEEDEISYEPEIINRKNKVVSIKNNASARIILKRPEQFQDVMEIVDAVKTRKIIVMNMSNADPKTAQRMIDYIVGACYALNGSFEEVEKCIYVFAPEGVEVTNELKNEMSRKEFYSFEG